MTMPLYRHINATRGSASSNGAVVEELMRPPAQDSA
jgi:hypothetical protein